MLWQPSNTTKRDALRGSTMPTCVANRFAEQNSNTHLGKVAD